MTNQIIHGDSLEVLKKIPDNSIDVVFADPPYNLQIEDNLFRPNNTKVDGVQDDWDKFESLEEYDRFTYNWLSECKRVLKRDGTIWVIGSYHNIFRVGKIMQDLGFWILNDIVWIKSNPMPNFRGTRFTNAHETLIWASHNRNSKYKFNYKSMKAFNDDKQMRSDWYLPIANGKERIKDSQGKKAHSTQKPLALLYRVILSSTDIGDTILDPFFGTGTTGAVAKLLRRNFIGIEKEEKYISLATKRIEEIKPLDSHLITLEIEKPKPRIPFGNLIEDGYIKVGEKLYSQNREIEATILANGTIRYLDEVGSIHKVSAKILGRSSNNGWLYWYIERDGDLINIDQIRERYRKEKGLI